MLSRTFPIVLAMIVGATVASDLSATQVINGVTCGRTSCPRPLELVDGEPVTVMLSGDGLGGLVSGIVTDEAGRLVDGVTVELAPFRLATRRGATVTARGAPALSGLQLRFRTRLRRTVTAPLELATAATVTTAPAILDPREPRLPGPSDADRTVSAESVTPAIMSVTPSPVLLDGSGSSGVVTLQGRSLDRLSDGRVRSADGRLSLPVTILPGDGSGDTDTRQVQVVSRETPLAGTGPRIVPNVPMQLVFDASSAAGAETIVAPVDVIQPMPDLVVTGVEVGAPQETYVDVRYVIENRGLAHARASLDRPWISGAFSPFQHVAPTPARFLAGAPGTTLTARLSYDSLPDSGTYEWVVRVPEDLSVGGSGEGPREMPFTVIVEPPARPDLVITGVTHRPGRLVTGPDPAFFSVEVLNQGERAASFPAGDVVEASNCPFLGSARVGGSELRPGGSFSAILSADMDAAPAGSHTCTFQVEYSVRGFWRESDRTNNSFPYSFDVVVP